MLLGGGCAQDNVTFFLEIPRQKVGLASRSKMLPEHAQTLITRVTRGLTASSLKRDDSYQSHSPQWSFDPKNEYVEIIKTGCVWAGILIRPILGRSSDILLPHMWDAYPRLHGQWRHVGRTEPYPRCQERTTPTVSWDDSLYPTWRCSWGC